MQRLDILVLVLGLLFAAGCGTVSPEEKARRQSLYSADLGTATAYEAQQTTEEFLRNRHQFLTFRLESSSDDFFYESEWRTRPPFEDEISLGIVEARNRVTVRGRPRARGVGSAGTAVSLDMTIENMVRLDGSDEWRYAPMTPEARTYARRIADDLKTEFQAGIRVY